MLRWLTKSDWLGPHNPILSGGRVRRVRVIGEKPHGIQERAGTNVYKHVLCGRDRRVMMISAGPL